MYIVALLALGGALPPGSISTEQCTMPLHPSQRTAQFDIRDVNVSDVASCCSACEAEPSCKYFEFVHTKNRCWLKTSGAGPKKYDITCTSGGITPPDRCRNDDDCSLCGTCNVSSGVCRCDRGFTGMHCELLNMGNPTKCGEGGLCMHGELVDGSKNGVASTTGYSTWGGSVVANADFSMFHMYASMFQMNASLEPKCESVTCAGWETNSAVVHATSQRAGGPYTAVDIALGPRGRVTRINNCTYKGGIPGTVCAVKEANDFWDAVTTHTPSATRIGEWYLIYYMGTMQNATNAKNGFPCLTNDVPPRPSDRAGGPACQQRVGLAVSKDPHGPWLRYDQNGLHNVSDTGSTFILPPGNLSAFDSAFTNNPTPLALPNASVLLVYKGRAAQCPACQSMRTGVAFAKTWRGPYKKRSSTHPFPVPPNCEDPTIYISPSGAYRVLFHCGCSYLVAVSRDGSRFRAIGQPKPWCDIKYEGGGSARLRRRERPQWVMGADGHPTHLMTGVMPDQDSHRGQTWTMSVELL